MTTLQFGDRVRHGSHPDWGIGSVVKVEAVEDHDGHVPRISVRFPDHGLEVLVGREVPLSVVDEPCCEPAAMGPRPPIAEVEDLERAGMDSAIEQKLMEIMRSIPIACRDPFNGPEIRLRNTLELYRYDTSGRGLIEWACTQTGMDDPLTRFNRTELEAYFQRWSHDRDEHLGQLLYEMRDDGDTVNRLVRGAPDSARRAASRVR